MKVSKLIFVAALLVAAVGAVAQDSSAQASPPAAGNATTVRGCLRGSRGNYVLIEDKTNLAYVLKGVGTKLNKELRHQVEVTGKVLPGTIKTGIRPEKAGSNPSDTVHGTDGIPLQVADVNSDVRVIGDKCKAADQQ